MECATGASSQAPPAPAAERAAPKESQRLDWLIVGLDVPEPGTGAAAGAGRSPAGSGRSRSGPCCSPALVPAAIDLVHEHGGRVFLDLKWHDIPNTVAGACRAAAEQGVWMVNVHAAGGERMLAAAREALDKARQPGTVRPSAHRRNRPDQPRRRRPASHRRHRLCRGAGGTPCCPGGARRSRRPGHLRPRGSGAARPLAALQHGRSRYPPSLVHLRRPRPRGRSAPRRHSGRHARRRCQPRRHRPSHHHPSRPATCCTPHRAGGNRPGGQNPEEALGRGRRWAATDARSYTKGG